MDKENRFLNLLDQFKDGYIKSSTLINYIRHNLKDEFWYKITDQYKQDQWWFKHCKQCQMCCYCPSCKHDRATWYQAHVEELYGDGGNASLLAPHSPDCKQSTNNQNEEGV